MQHASTSTTLAEDAAVRSTDTDALVSRCAAASLDYLDDKLSPLFLAPNQRRNLDRRPPLINIGTHARTYALDRLVADFLLLDHHQVGHQPARQCQVVSLGAGTDSRFWRIRTLFDQQGRDWPCKHWVEVDFPEATSAKARTVASKPVLRDALGGNVKIELGGQGLSSSLYSLLPGDIRSLDALTSSLVASPSNSSSSSISTEPVAPTRPAPLSPALPTLLLLECVLVYVPPAAADALLAWFARTWGACRGEGGGGQEGEAPPGGAVVMYDPFGLDDKFGEVMRRNLAARGLSLPGSPATPTLSSLEERLVRAGARGRVGSRTVREIRERCLPREELERVNAIERIDEVEELNLVLEHYAVSWANLLPSEGEGAAGRGGEGAGGGGGGIGLRDAVEEEGS